MKPERALRIVILSLLLVSCRSSLGVEAGAFETLETELVAQRAAIESILADALGQYELLGEDVGVYTCDPTSEWRPHTTLVVAPADGDRLRGVAAVAQLLEDRGVSVDVRDAPGVRQRTPSYYAKLDDFEEPLSFYSGSQPVSGFEISLVGGCYGEGRIEADNALDLDNRQGIATLVHE